MTCVGSFKEETCPLARGGETGKEPLCSYLQAAMCRKRNGFMTVNKEMKVKERRAPSMAGANMKQRGMSLVKRNTYKDHDEASAWETYRDAQR